MTRTDLITAAVHARRDYAAAATLRDPHLTPEGVRARQRHEVAAIRATLRAATPVQPIADGQQRWALALGGQGAGRLEGAPAGLSVGGHGYLLSRA